MAIVKYMKACHIEVGADLLSVIPSSEPVVSNKMEAISQWNKAVNSPFLEVLKHWLDGHLLEMLYWILH